ncbi:MAG: Hpt domain-containing protein, partial [Candidatus Cloacimonadota bacterium]|nr:Hpt domain-containing protein [Candidatus Cloacimonadota bacterium]
MDDKQNKFAQIFIEEATELLEDLVDSLLELESEPNNVELINTIFRSFHTIKGSASMFGFDDIASFTHKIEDAYDLARDGKLQITNELINVTLLGRDFIESLLRVSSGGEPPAKEEGDKILGQFAVLADGDVQPAANTADKSSSMNEDDNNANEVTYWIHFHPKDSLYLSGNNPIFLIQELQTLGQCTVMTHFEDVPKIDELEAVKSYSYWNIFLTTERHEEAIDDVFMFVEDDAEINIEIIDRNETIDLHALNDKIVNTLKKQVDLDKSEIRELIQKEINEAKEFKISKQSKKSVTKISNMSPKKIKVDSTRLDTLVDLVGELVIAEASLNQYAKDKNEHILLQITDQIERISKNLREETLSLRMLPIEIIFNKYRRIVRDLANDLKKNIELKISGAETRIDKSMSDKLSDPLVHLIR